MKVAVAGGTGVVGTHVVEVAREHGHDVVVLTRGNGVDLRTGAGLDTALHGVDVVIDVAGVQTTSAKVSTEFFTTTTRALLDAERRANVKHHVALSIVGIDRAPVAYYAGKVAQEALVEAGTVPWTILRATQFHEFAAQMYSRAMVGPIHLAPRMLIQPIAAHEVAQHLVELAVAPPAGRVPDLAGPREEHMPEMIRAYAGATGHTGRIPAVTLPGAFGRAMRDGSVLPGPGAVLGRQTFSEWIADMRPVV